MAGTTLCCVVVDPAVFNAYKGVYEQHMINS